MVEESENIQKKGLDFLLQNTENSLFGLLKSDIKVRVLSEFFSKTPENM